MKVKLNYPGAWNFYLNSLPALAEYLSDDIQLEINNDCNFCDIWFVWGNLDKVEKVEVSTGIVFFIAEEAYPEKKYPDNFLQQFQKVVATREDIIHEGFVRTHYTGSWFIHRNYHQLTTDLSVDQKQKSLSVISSDLTILEGHKKRFAFVNRLIGHFKDRIDVYGRGYNEINDKSKGLSPYKYSIAIENSVIPDYFTEKIWDCYLTNTLPFYYGCPNIEDYFPAKAFIKIDINDFKRSIEIIEMAIENDAYSNAVSALREARSMVLSHYSIVPFIRKIINNLMPLDTRPAKCVVRPIEYFQQPSSFWKSIF